jgi:phenylacetate-CoA ligase
MQKFITKKIILPLQDFKNGTSVLKTLAFLNDSQYWGIEQFRDYQLEKIKKIVHFAYSNVEYYHNLFKANGLTPEKIKSIEDFKKIPVLNKDIARAENKKLRASNWKYGKIYKSFTGGTTGTPLKLYKDNFDYSFTWASYYRWLSWLGLEIGDRYAKIWGTPTVLSYSIKNRLLNSVKDILYNRVFINSFNLKDRDVPVLIKKLNSAKPLLIRGSVSSLMQIANYMLEHSLELNYSPLAISPTSESLLPTYRNVLEKAFNGKVFNQYGCGECNSISFECKQQNGMHISMEHAFVEIVDENNMPANGTGKIVVTNLDNFAMPFIRYEIGDMGEFNNIQCACGNKQQIIKSIAGRTSDYIITKNKSKVRGAFFTDILMELNINDTEKIKRFQVYQSKEGEIEFRIESSKKISNFFLQKLNAALLKFFTDVNIKVIKNIPNEPNGKFRYLISNI